MTQPELIIPKPPGLQGVPSGQGIQPEEFQLMRDLIENACGIVVDADKTYLIETRLNKLLAQAGAQNYREFYQKAKDDQRLRDKIVDAMTTNETLWFRDNKPFTLMQDLFFPQYINEIRSGKRSDVKIWSAACSTGQEPYSTAIIAHEMARLGKGSQLVDGKLSILATDISPSMVILARNGRYDKLAISRGMPDDMCRQYFDEDGSVWVLKEKIRNMVKFEQFNLQRSFMPLGKFDMILLRNVAIYFSKSFKEELFDKVSKALNPGGVLIIGASESMIGYKTPFEMKEYNKCFYYQVKS